MVIYRNVLVGGNDVNASKKYFSGIVFKLDKRIQECKTYKFDDWEVEVKKSDFIVARTENIYAREEIHNQGHAVCEKALDMLCVKGGDVYHITEPYSKYIELLFDTGEYSLIIHDKENLSFYISLNLSVMNREGNIIQRVPEQQGTWEEVFRYYRFSKGSSNVYDAYRWMYLVFELLMQSMAPILLRANGKPAEGEQVWIKRALNVADSRFQWSSKMNWSATDKIGYFISEQYHKIRCRLFHAKGNHILPNEQLEQKTIQEKLLELESLCWYFLYEMYSTSKKSGGLTDYGFTNLKDVFLDGTTAFMCNKVLEPKGDGDIIELDDSVVLLEDVSSTSDVKLRNILKIYRTDLAVEKQYLINSYGVNVNDEIVVYGNLSKMDLAIYGVGKLYLELQTHIANHEESFKYV